MPKWLTTSKWSCHCVFRNWQKYSEMFGLIPYHITVRHIIAGHIFTSACEYFGRPARRTFTWFHCLCLNVILVKTWNMFSTSSGMRCVHIGSYELWVFRLMVKGAWPVQSQALTLGSWLCCQWMLLGYGVCCTSSDFWCRLGTRNISMNVSWVCWTYWSVIWEDNRTWLHVCGLCAKSIVQFVGFYYLKFFLGSFSIVLKSRNTCKRIILICLPRLIGRFYCTKSRP